MDVQKLGVSQQQHMLQKLSPQQIQFIKLLQIPTAELRSRVEEELEINPVLEEGRESDEEDKYEEDNNNEEDYNDSADDGDDMSLNDYLMDGEYDYDYKLYSDNNQREEEREMPIAMVSSLNDNLMTQLNFLGLNEVEKAIGSQIIGSLDNDGYLRRPIEAIVNDLAFSVSIETDEDEVEAILRKIQFFDPPGIATRSLQECLLVQILRKEQDNGYSDAATKILEHCFDEFNKKHYDKIQKKLGLDDHTIKKAVELILKLNPKPGESSSDLQKGHYIIPDFILHNNSNKLELSLNSNNAPELRINHTYAEMLDTYSKGNKKDRGVKETLTFVKQKIEAARWFIDAIKQRQQTLLRTMNAIIEYQYEFFLEGDESKFKPMILKDIADRIDMDISTVSRVANSKSIQTDFGIFPLKYFFSEGIATDSGEDVSSREVKNALKDIVDKENKRKPLSDDKLEKILQSLGYQIARRTVAKYREQLNIPVARLRKKL